jgi:hypothetical protein
VALVAGDAVERQGVSEHEGPGSLSPEALEQLDRAASEPPYD